LSTLFAGGTGFIGSNHVEEHLAAGENVVVMHKMHTGSPGNLEGLQGSLKLIRASCNDLPGMDLHPEKSYHLGIPSSSPMCKKNPYLVGEALNGFTTVFERTMKLDHGILNMWTGKAYTFNQRVAILNKNMGLALKPQHVENPIKNYVQHTLSDTAKARKCSGLRQNTTWNKD
jgi:nucleoside-diphosphate-sugar epimerase